MKERAATVESIREMIQTRRIACRHPSHPESGMAAGDDPDFSDQWRAAHTAIGELFRANPPSTETQLEFDELRRRIADAVRQSTHDECLAGYVVDDFALLFYTNALGYRTNWTDRLWMTYQAGFTPYR